MKVCDFPSAEAKPTAEQTDEPCLKATRCWQIPTRLYQQFELSVVEYILVGMAGGQCLSVSVGPFVLRCSLVNHPLQECGDPE